MAFVLLTKSTNPKRGDLIMRLNTFLSISLLAALTTFSYSAKAGRTIQDATCDLAIASADGVQFALSNGSAVALDESNFSILQDKGYSPYILEVNTATDEELKSVKLSLGIQGTFQKKSERMSFCLICFGNSSDETGTINLSLKKRGVYNEQLQDRVISVATADAKDGSNDGIQSAIAQAYKKLPNCQKSSK